MLRGHCLLMLFLGLSEAGQGGHLTRGQQMPGETNARWQKLPAVKALEAHADLSNGSAPTPSTSSAAAASQSGEADQTYLGRPRRHGSATAHSHPELAQTDGYSFGSKSAARSGVGTFHQKAMAGESNQSSEASKSMNIATRIALRLGKSASRRSLLSKYVPAGAGPASETAAAAISSEDQLAGLPMHNDPTKPSHLGSGGLDEPWQRRPKGHGFAEELWNLHKQLGEAQAAAKKLQDQVSALGRAGSGHSSTYSGSSSETVQNGGDHGDQQLQAAQQVLLKLQEAFYAGNISMTDDGMPDVPNSNTPSEALKASLHLMPDGKACAPFTAPHVERIAIVGNGPLTAAHARAANQHDLVVRFNMLDNISGQDSGEKVDIWLMRYAWETTLHYWGLARLRELSSHQATEKVQGVFLVGGSPLFVDYARLMVPALASKSVHFLPLEMFAWKEIYGQNASRDAVTTGMAGILTALTCSRPNTTIDIYAMNWPKNLWHRHKGVYERAWLQMLQAQGRIQIHEPPCGDLRSCSGPRHQGDRLGSFSKLVAHFHRKQVRGQDSIGKLQ